jgi:hypothetical protein
VERVVREVKESFLAWLCNKPPRARLTLPDHDETRGQRWAKEVVDLPPGPDQRSRRGRGVGEAWRKSRSCSNRFPLASLGYLPLD